MPRLELTPPNWDGSKEQARGDGAPVVDLCVCCACMYSVGDVIGSGEPIGYSGFTVTTLDCGHPGYDSDYKCNACGQPLTEDDN